MQSNWETILKDKNISGYWKVTPLHEDCLDAMDYEIAYLYFDGRWCVYRIGEIDIWRPEDFVFHGMVMVPV